MSADVLPFPPRLRVVPSALDVRRQACEALAERMQAQAQTAWLYAPTNRMRDIAAGIAALAAQMSAECRAPDPQPPRGAA